MAKYMRYFIVYMILFIPLWYKLTELYRANIREPVAWESSQTFPEREFCIYVPKVAWHVYIVHFKEVPGSIKREILEKNLNFASSELPLNITYSIYEVHENKITLPTNQKNIQSIMNEYTTVNLFEDNVIHTIVYNVNETESRNYLRIPRWGSIHTEINYDSIVDSLLKVHCKLDNQPKADLYRKYIDYYGLESYDLVRSLRKLVNELYNMIVPDTIADFVDDYRQHILIAKNETDLHNAVYEAGKAYRFAHKAYYHPSITSVQTYPDEHKYAIYCNFYSFSTFCVAIRLSYHCNTL
eukprot:NODE_26_length_40862_cov_0.679513.p17 type:complete len:297 gc:universal NODE_26_length_40862_cov_0.679513:15331-16221(+)